MQVTLRTCPWGGRAALFGRLATLTLALGLGTARANAQPTAFMANPEHTEWISSTSTQGGIGTFYVMNGLVNNADHVDIKIVQHDTSTVVVDTANVAFVNPIGHDSHQAVVKDGLWEYRWDVADPGVQLPGGPYDITVTPKLGNQVGKLVDADDNPVGLFWVYLYNNDPGPYQTLAPGGALNFIGRTNISGLFISSDQFHINYARVPIQIRADGVNRAVKGGTLSEPHTIGQDFPNGSTSVNGDAIAGVPGEYVIGGNPLPLTDGIYAPTLVLKDDHFATNPVPLQRRVIVDFTAPQITGTTIGNLSPTSVYLTGVATDPKPGAGIIASGIASVDVVVTPPSGAANNVTAKAMLSYGTTFASGVNFYAAYQGSETGTFNVTITATDRAGNKTITTTSFTL